MNIEPTSWAGQAPNPQQPMSSGLRAAFALEQQLPAEFQRLLSRLDSPVSGAALRPVHRRALG